MHSDFTSYILCEQFNIKNSLHNTSEHNNIRLSDSLEQNGIYVGNYLQLTLLEFNLVKKLFLTSQIL